MPFSTPTRLDKSDQIETNSTGKGAGNAAEASRGKKGAVNVQWKLIFYNFNQIFGQKFK